MSTIVPLIPEAAWLPVFADLTDWQLPLVSTLVLAPHPDDETLGAGVICFNFTSSIASHALLGSEPSPLPMH